MLTSVHRFEVLTSNVLSLFLAVIEEANWLSLQEDIDCPEGEVGFDAIMCMGNSFAHLPDFFGDQRDHHIAIDNFFALLKPGGILVIDHRNYDYILEHGKAPKKNVYYNVRARTNPSMVTARKNDFLIFSSRASTSKTSRRQCCT